MTGDADLLHRALFNLVLNGVQWAGEGGNVQITLSRLSSDIVSPSLGASDVVRICVSDSGPGVPAEIAEQIFDPFFTLRPGGTGLGLALVQRTVEAHRGAVFVDRADSSDEEGASFCVYLPVSLPTRETAPSAVLEESLP